MQINNKHSSNRIQNSAYKLAVFLYIYNMSNEILDESLIEHKPSKKFNKHNIYAMIEEEDDSEIDLYGYLSE